MTGKYTKSGRLDKRFAVNKKIEAREYELTQKYAPIIGKWLLVILSAFIFANVVTRGIYNYTHPEIISPKGLGIARVPKIMAMETKNVTPTSTPNRRYLKYKNMPHYQNIISELQMLYTNWEDAADLQSRENGFNPYAINPTSGACGLTQALPCKKLTCKLGDIKCDLKWQKEYISQRYGTVTKALKFQLKNNWY